MNRKSFTLIELLIVITIIGILVSISVYGWTSVAVRGRDSTRKSDLARIKQSLQLYYSDYRAYPQLDTSGGRIFAASYQLASSGTTCPHFDNTFGLPPKYLAEVPKDPKDATNYQNENSTCTVLSGDQRNRYLYLATSVAGPASEKFPTRFGLMATLERIQDPLLDSLNPFVTADTYLGPLYKDRTYQVNPNYLLDDQNQ